MILGTAEPQKTAYSVEIDPKAFLAMTRAESDWSIPYDEHLVFRLEGEGPTRKGREVEYVHSVEYDAHFGPAVYYTVDAEDESEELHSQVLDIIRSQLERAAELKNTHGGPTP